jgi:hypothetical protein
MAIARSDAVRPRDADVERPDLRVLAVFVLVCAVLLAPAIPRMFGPVTSAAASDAAGVLDAEAREGIALAGERPRTTATYLATELADLAASAAETRLDLLHAEAAPGAAASRLALIDLGGQVRGELELMSVSVDDPVVLARGAQRLRAISVQLEAIASG